MKLSTRGRYLLRVFIDMAQHKDDGYIPLRTIADRQGISKKYLDQIMILLNRTDYLKAARGAQGGYRLAKEPDQYTLGDILRLTEGNLSLLPCLESGDDCDRSKDCAARCAWQGLRMVMVEYLDNLTLQNILDQGNCN